MLRELQVAAREGEPRRRWFADKDLDLFVWIADDSVIDSFQLCYVRAGSEYALTWTRGSGCHIDRVDAGEGAPTRNDTPILVSCTGRPAGDLLRCFLERSVDIDPDIRRVIEEQLRAAADYASRKESRGFQTTRLASEGLS
jgi:hypothetical protein